MKAIFYLLLSLLLFNACDLIEYSPNQAFDRNTPRDLNQKHIARLVQNSGDDTIRFALVGDSQRAYKDASDFVETANNKKGLDFVLLAGDISDFGLLNEMEWIDKIFSKLNAPYIGVIGNHDMVANGENVFKRMYGKLNFSFIYKGIKFVCHNTNSREVNFDGNVPDMPWLKSELGPSAGVDAYIAVAHVPPFSVDFDPRLEASYVNLINSSPNTLAALYAHNHSEEVRYPNDQAIPYLVTYNIGRRQFLLIEIIEGRLKYESVKY
ncbi:metallophosphoesterase [Pedobacter sp. P351]|uniref:metallophosphoesterase family protein n=1 Tax=Pedobacter superstes TaxID=3133441 RepID=UPI0030A2E8E2